MGRPLLIERETAVRWARWILAVSLLGSTAVFAVVSRRWPLVGDASLIHYICFLMDHGFRPYRDLGDMNMPGSLLIEWAAMHALGGGAGAWHVFDWGLLLAAGGAMFLIARRPGRDGWRRGWFAGLFAACLLALVHGRDGMGQTGQRDLTMAVALLVATAFLFEAVRRSRPAMAAEMVAAAGFGIFAGVASTVKPTALPFGAVLLVLAAVAMRRRGAAAGRVVWMAVAGYAVAPVVAVGFLVHEQAVRAFLHSARTLVPFYASLGHRPVGFLLLHSISPLLPVVLLWLAALLARGLGHDQARLREDSGEGWFGSWERLALGFGVGFGLISYMVQARGFPYYRYPLLVYLLPLMAIDFEEMVRWGSGARWPGVRMMSGRRWRGTAGRAAGWIAAAGLVTGALIVAPTSAVLLARYDPTNLDFITSLQAELESLGGASLSGHVQCIDSIAGCGTTLYRMRLVQATGVLSDFLLFGPTRLPEGGAASIPIVRETRGVLMGAMRRDPPRVLVVSSYLHIDGPEGYRKLERWPELEQVLATQYELRTEWRPRRPEHWWSRQVWPSGYRVYVLRGSGV